MDFEHLDQLGKCGFLGGVRVTELQISCDSVPAEQGVYLVARESTDPVKFLETSTGGHFRNRDPAVPIATLQAQWLDGPTVFYIGKAGRAGQNVTLRSRIRCFMRFGLGQPVAHWGGRYIWQLADATELLVYWKPTPYREPRELERKLLAEFKNEYDDRLPFANLQM